MSDQKDTNEEDQTQYSNQADSITLKLSDLTVGVTLRSPDGNLAKTEGGMFTIKKYNNRSGNYTLTRTEFDCGVPDTLHLHEGELLNHWKLA
jgi:hypothetical protein